MANNTPHNSRSASPTMLAAQRLLEQRRRELDRSPRRTTTFTFPTATRPTPPPTKSTQIAVMPTIAHGMLRTQQSAPGRLWLLLRWFDSAGCGWITVETARRTFARHDAPHRLCGWRQLRNLLRDGDGIFWRRDRERIWLRSQARVAVALGIERVSGTEQTVPLGDLLGSIGQTRASFYTLLHANRTASPIARTTIQTLTGVSATTQRRYERSGRVKIRPNFALGQPFSAESHQAHCARYGRATYQHIDHAGRFGPAKTAYSAHQLPNSYSVVTTSSRQTQPARSRHARRRLNRQIRDLLPMGTTGNTDSVRRLFFAGARQALQTAGANDAACWPSTMRNFWHVMTEQ